MVNSSFDSHNLVIDFGFGINNSVIHVFSVISGTSGPRCWCRQGRIRIFISSRQAGDTHTHTHQTNERISRSDTYGAVENLKLELSKRLSHCRIWLCFTCMVKKNKMKLKVNYHGQFCCSFSVRCVASMLV